MIPTSHSCGYKIKYQKVLTWMVVGTTQMYHIQHPYSLPLSPYSFMHMMVVHTHAHTHMHTHAHMHTHMHTHTCTHAHTRTHTYTHTHAPARTHTYTHTHAHTRTYTHTCTHTHAHLHTHTHRVGVPSACAGMWGPEEGSGSVCDHP